MKHTPLSAKFGVSINAPAVAALTKLLEFAMRWWVRYMFTSGDFLNLT